MRSIPPISQFNGSQDSYEIVSNKPLYFNSTYQLMLPTIDAHPSHLRALLSDYNLV